MLAGQCSYRFCNRALHGVVLRCRSAGHSQQVVTGLNSTIGVCGKARMPRAVAVQADTPLRYVTAFK